MKNLKRIIFLKKNMRIKGQSISNMKIEYINNYIYACSIEKENHHRITMRKLDSKYESRTSSPTMVQ
jgi:hypothetical protein